MSRIIIISFLLVLASCSNGIPRVEKPDDVIPREKMVSLLTELVKLEAYVVNEYGSITVFHEVMINSGDSLLKVKGFSKEQLEGSLNYYGSHQDQIMSIYADVLENLNKELGELEHSHE